jgi:hypothetical protein
VETKVGFTPCFESVVSIEVFIVFLWDIRLNYIRQPQSFTDAVLLYCVEIGGMTLLCQVIEWDITPVILLFIFIDYLSFFFQLSHLLSVYGGQLI